MVISNQTVCWKHPRMSSLKMRNGQNVVCGAYKRGKNISYARTWRSKGGGVFFGRISYM